MFKPSSYGEGDIRCIYLVDLPEICALITPEGAADLILTSMQVRFLCLVLQLTWKLVKINTVASFVLQKERVEIVEHVMKYHCKYIIKTYWKGKFHMKPGVHYLTSSMQVMT